MIDAIITTLQIMVFPGILFLVSLALFFEWIDRKVVAKAQRRYGPLHTGYKGILQPLADILKLLAEEIIQ
jgi:NADH-quinone oxidoreductase subunit H